MDGVVVTTVVETVVVLVVGSDVECSEKGDLAWISSEETVHIRTIPQMTVCS